MKSFYIIFLILILQLSGCGFHLRGVNKNLVRCINNIGLISTNNDKQFLSILKSQLENSKVQVNPSSKHASYLLIIEEVLLSQQIISIGASTNPRQYVLTLTVPFKLQTRQGEIETSGKVSSSRQLILNNDRILGSKNEESILIKEMKEDTIIQILNRLSRLKKTCK